MSDRLFDTFVRFAGYTATELSDHPWRVRLRRLVFGILVVSSGFFAAVMLAMAVARIAPQNPYRWIFGLLAGLVYFAAVAGYDSLFVASTDANRGRSVWLRVALSLVLMAFSATTLDASIAGPRLGSEIDRRKAEATLASQQLHRKVHSLDEKQVAFNSVGNRLHELDSELAGDPQTTEFDDAVAAVGAALQDWRDLESSVTPKISSLKQQIASSRAKLATLDDSQADERASLNVLLAEARAHQAELQRQLAEKKRVLDTAASRADALRKEWRAEKVAQRTQVARDRNDAAKALHSAQVAADKDGDTTRAANAEAFQANLVEEMVAFWSLAARERGYLAIGVVVWMAAVAFELLAILAKILMKPDSLDEQRRAESALAAIDAETRVQIAKEDGVDQQWRQARAAIEADIFFKALQLKRSASERVATALVASWEDIQRRKAATADEGVRASLESQFVGFQRALDSQFQAFIGGTGAAPGSSAVAEATPELAGTAATRTAADTKTVVL